MSESEHRSIRVIHNPAYAKLTLLALERSFSSFRFKLEPHPLAGCVVIQLDLSSVPGYFGRSAGLGDNSLTIAIYAVSLFVSGYLASFQEGE